MTMVIHVGISPVLGKISTYNTEIETFNDYEISQVRLFEPEINNVDKMFEEIKSKIDGDYGCLCIEFGSWSQDICRYVVDSALSNRFKEIQLMGFIETSFYGAISQSNYNHENSNVILICSEATLYIFLKQNGQFTYKSFQINEFLKKKMKQLILFEKYNVEPKVIYYNRNTNQYLIKKNFPQFDYIYYETMNYSQGALYKARIMGNDQKIVHFNVENRFWDSIILQGDRQKLIKVYYGETLPLAKRVILEQKPYPFHLLKVYNGKSVSPKETIMLPFFKKTLITITVDKNGIYSVTFENILNDIKEPRLNIRNYYFRNFCFLNAYNFPAKIQINDDIINVVGIDLGTTRCCAAVNRKSGIETVALDNQGQRLLPSYVAYDEEKEKCGQIVVDRLRNYATSTIFDSKRLLGKKLNEIKIDNSWPFELVKAIIQQYKSYKCAGNVFIKLSKPENNVVLKRPEEISAVLLQYIKSKAEEFQGKKLTEAVITIPAAFDKEQMNATYEAGIIAGFENIHLLPEPVAAAFAYFIDRPIPNNEVLLLFDLGGGTLDVCIFKTEKNMLKIISKNGDRNLGGRDFDNILINYFNKKMRDELGIEVTNNRMYKLMQECQKIKENLSTLKEDILDVENFDPSNDSNIAISRDQFEELSFGLVDRIRRNIQAALNVIRFKGDHINKVLQVGGGCRMPMIIKLLQEMFPNSEHIREQNPEEVVAVGAAYYAYYLNTPNNGCSIV